MLLQNVFMLFLLSALGLSLGMTEIGEVSKRTGSPRKKTNYLEAATKSLEEPKSITQSTIKTELSSSSTAASLSQDQRSKSDILHAKDRRANKDVINVATYNARWLVLPDPQTRTMPKNCTWKTYYEATKHIYTIAKYLELLDADVVVLSEIEGLEVLEVLCKHIKQGQKYRPYLVSGYDKFNGMNVGVLTKVDAEYAPYRISRDMQYTLVDQKGVVTKTGNVCIAKNIVVPMLFCKKNGTKVPFVVFGVHLFSQPEDKLNCAKREAQAQILRDEIDEHSRKGYSVVVAGDLNDYDDFYPDARNSRPKSTALSIIKGKDLDNAMGKLKPEKRVSCRRGTMIDHILPSFNLQILTVGISKISTFSQTGSDHGMYYVKFQL